MTYVSPRCAELLGWSAEAADWRDAPRATAVDRQLEIDSVSYASPSLAPQWQQYRSLLVEALPLVDALHENRTVSDTTLVHTCPDGVERLITWDVAPIRSASAAVDGVVAVGRDVTEERRQRERSLAAVARAVASAPDKPDLNARVTLILTALAENTSSRCLPARYIC
jgi:PAS domain-containing protein